MDIQIEHVKNPALGWDIIVSVVAEAGQRIAGVNIKVNSVSECSERIVPAVVRWHKQLHQKGVYPGENKVEVTATSESGGDSDAESSW